MDEPGEMQARGDAASLPLSVSSVVISWGHQAQCPLFPDEGHADCSLQTCQLCGTGDAGSPPCQDGAETDTQRPSCSFCNTLEQFEGAYF